MGQGREGTLRPAHTGVPGGRGSIHRGPVKPCAGSNGTSLWLYPPRQHRTLPGDIHRWSTGGPVIPVVVTVEWPSPPVPHGGYHRGRTVTGRGGVTKAPGVAMIHPQVHLRIPCYDFSFL